MSDFLLDPAILERYGSPEASKSLVEDVVRNRIDQEKLQANAGNPDIPEIVSALDRTVKDVRPAYIAWQENSASNVQLTILKTLQIRFRELINEYPVVVRSESVMAAAIGHGALPDLQRMRYLNIDRGETCWDCEDETGWKSEVGMNYEIQMSPECRQTVEDIWEEKGLIVPKIILRQINCFYCNFPA